MTELARDSSVSFDSIQRHSKSFALASRLLPTETRVHAVAVYAWCRRADDAVDLEDPESQPAALARLESELRAVYEGADLADPVLALFQQTVDERSIPPAYPLDLLQGMEMDVRGRRYETVDDLLEYCYHVAGCVGLMMCHVMGLRDDEALPRAAHLGMAMQLTNICRDVEEDWRRDRLYIPDEVLARFGAQALADRLGEPFPPSARNAVSRAIDHLLVEADRYYASGDEGLSALSWRCALAIRAARRVYSAIGDRIRLAGCDPLAGRAYVSLAGKLMLVARSTTESLAELPGRMGGSHGEPSPPDTVIDFTHVPPA